MATKKTSKSAKKAAKPPTRKAAKSPTKKAVKRGAESQEQTFKITVQATMRMRVELEIEAESEEEAYVVAENICMDGEISYSEFRIIEVVDGPDVC